MTEKRLATDQVPFTSGGGGASILQSTSSTRVAGPDTTASLAFVPVGAPGATLISFTLQNDSSVILAAYGTTKRINPGSTNDTVIGIRVDGATDYAGTRAYEGNFGIPNGVDCVIALPLLAGPHTAEVVYKWGGDAPGLGILESNATTPTRISAAWMDPVYGVGSLTKLQSIVAGVPGSTFPYPGPPPYNIFLPVPGSQIGFTLPVNQTVYFSGVGTATGAAFGGWTGTQIGLRVDGNDYPGNDTGNLDANGRDCLAVSYALDLTSGPHVAELCIRRNSHPIALPEVCTGSDAPLVLNALFTRPEQLYQAETVANPAQIDAGDAGSPGAALKVSLSDHQHPVNTATLNTDIQPTGTANNAGASSKLPRADHVHRLLLEGQEEGAAVGSRPKINFIGAAVTVADNIGADRLDVTVTGASLTASTNPTTIQPDDAAAIGISTEAARADHKHANVADVAGAIAIGDSAAEGASTSFSRADHRHSLAAPAAPADVTKAAAAAGVATSPARADHKHDVSTANVTDITDATNAEGTATSLARSDHTHSHGSRGGGGLHTLATVAVAGFMSAADKTKLDGLPSSITARESVKWVGAGQIIVATNVDGAWVAPRAGTIKRITAHRRVTGVSGSLIVDVNKNQVTVFTTQANRPTIAAGANNAISARTNMDITAFAQDDQFQFDVDQAEGGNSQDVSVIMEVEY